MSQPRALILETRGVLKATGPDVRAFLQGIVSNDVLREIERRLGVRIDGVSVQIHARRAAGSTERDGRS